MAPGTSDGTLEPHPSCLLPLRPCREKRRSRRQRHGNSQWCHAPYRPVTETRVTTCRAIIHWGKGRGLLGGSASSLVLSTPPSCLLGANIAIPRATAGGCLCPRPHGQSVRPSRTPPPLRHLPPIPTQHCRIRGCGIARKHGARKFLPWRKYSLVSDQVHPTYPFQGTLIPC